MVIPNNFIKLDYNPATDILYVEWPNIHDYTTSEFRNILDEVVATVKNYDIKKLLADSTKSVVTMQDTEYTKIVNQFFRNLMVTRLQKLARFTAGVGFREAVANQAADFAKEAFSIKNFDSLDEAFDWLTGSTILRE